MRNVQSDTPRTISETSKKDAFIGRGGICAGIREKTVMRKSFCRRQFKHTIFEGKTYRREKSLFFHCRELQDSVTCGHQHQKESGGGD